MLKDELFFDISGIGAVLLFRLVDDIHLMIELGIIRDQQFPLNVELCLPGRALNQSFTFTVKKNIYFNIRFFFSFKFCAVKDGLLVKYLEFASLLNLAPAPAPAPAFPSLAPEGALLPAPIFHPADQQVCWP